MSGRLFCLNLYSNRRAEHIPRRHFISFTATAWGVVKAHIQDNFLLLLCHRCSLTFSKEKCKDVTSYQESEAFGCFTQQSVGQDEYEQESQDSPLSLLQRGRRYLGNRKCGVFLKTITYTLYFCDTNAQC